MTWRTDAYRSREVDWVRRSVNDGLRWAGTKCLCRQIWTLQDFEEGKVERCSSCWDDILKQSNNSRCLSCYGTTFEGGYQSAFVTWCTLAENQPVDTKTENSGVRPSDNMELRLPVNRIFHNGDMFAEIVAEGDSGVTKIGRLFKLDGPVQQKTVQGWVSDDHDDAGRHIDLANIMVEQRGTVKEMLPSDLLYSDAVAFWGLAAHPYIDAGVNQDKIEGF